MNKTDWQRKPSTGIIRLAHLIFNTGAAIFIVSGFAWYLGRSFVSDNFLPLRTANAIAPFFLIAAVPLFLLALLLRRWLPAGGLAVLAVLVLAHYWPVLGPARPVAVLPTDGLHLRVMSYNVWAQNDDYLEIATLTGLQAPDLLVVQEAVHPPDLQRALQAQYPYFLHDNYARGGSQLIFSRYPLVEEAKPENVGWMVQRAKMITPQGEIAVWNVHPTSALVRWWPTQNRVMRTIAEAIAQETRPVILMGDLNQTDQHENYRLLTDVLIDLHWVVGRGFGFTYPNFEARLRRIPEFEKMDLLGALLGPVVRIDHILISSQFIPIEERVVRNGVNSDHYPVIGDIYLVP